MYTFKSNIDKQLELIPALNFVELKAAVSKSYRLKPDRFELLIKTDIKTHNLVN